MNKISRHLKISIVGIIAVALWILGPGFYRDLSANSEETYEGLKLFSDVIEIIEKNYVDPVDSKKMIEDAIQGMVSSLDPHSALLTPDAFKELQMDTQGEFTGIGIHVTMRNNLVTVIAPIEGTPAYRAGIKAGDKIVKVDGEPTEDLRDAVKRMRGPQGTEVTITILREEPPNPIDFKIIRDVIPIHSVKATMLKPGYGYIWVTNFRDNTTSDLLDALGKLEKKSTPLKGLILDLRDNPGGVLNQATQVADLFLEDGEILSIKGRLKKNTKVFYAHKNKVPRDYPIVVLINAGSASASEIVAGALQDQKRALILGTTSFGKGSVQTVSSLRDGYGLKFTIARYYTPSGRSIQAKGVKPDIVIPHRTITKEETKVERKLKESDLRHHLKSRTNKASETKPEPNPKDKTLNPKQEAGKGGLEKDLLMSDNQVLRALDILISYDIFNHVNN